MVPEGLEETPPALRPGSINRMFTRLTTDIGLNTTVLSADPWVVLVHNAVMEDELELLMEVCFPPPVPHIDMLQ